MKIRPAAMNAFGIACETGSPSAAPISAARATARFSSGLDSGVSPLARRRNAIQKYMSLRILGSAPEVGFIQDESYNVILDHVNFHTLQYISKVQTGDPLSLISSITAILRLAGNVVQFLSDVKDASTACNKILIEIGSINSLLFQHKGVWWTKPSRVKYG